MKQLAATPCQYDVLKRAALFSCLTGLRISDILKLRWEEIERASDGGWWNKLVRVFPYGDSEVAIRDYSNFDRIWVDEDWIAIDMYEPKQGKVRLSFIDEYTGTHVFVDGQDFLPIKDL